MRRLVHDEEFRKEAYREWPLFKGLRKAEGFKDVYKECYDEEFPAKESVSKSEDVEDDQEEESN